MGLQISATISEQQSSFFSKNASICKQFQEYILNRNGSVKGTYGAYSFFVEAQIKNHYKWELTIEKASPPASNHLFLDEKLNSPFLNFTLSVNLHSPEHRQFEFIHHDQANFFQRNHLSKFRRSPIHTSYWEKGKPCPIFSDIQDVLWKHLLYEQVQQIRILKNEVYISVNSFQGGLIALDDLMQSLSESSYIR